MMCATNNWRIRICTVYKVKLGIIHVQTLCFNSRHEGGSIVPSRRCIHRIFQEEEQDRKWLYSFVILPFLFTFIFPHLYSIPTLQNSETLQKWMSTTTETRYDRDSPILLFILFLLSFCPQPLLNTNVNQGYYSVSILFWYFSVLFNPYYKIKCVKYVSYCLKLRCIMLYILVIMASYNYILILISV